MTYHRACLRSKTTGATYGAGIAYPSGAPEFNPVFGVRVARCLAFCVIVLSVICPLIYGFWLHL